LLKQYQAPSLPGLPPFLGGAVGYAGYDTVRYVERLGKPPPDDRGLPDLSFGLYDRMVVFDHVSKTIAVVGHAHVDPDDPRRSYAGACACIDDLVERLSKPEPRLPLVDISPGGAVKRPYESNIAADRFEHSVERAKEYIKAGDIFQVVLSQR